MGSRVIVSKNLVLAKFTKKTALELKAILLGLNLILCSRTTLYRSRQNNLEYNS